MDSSRGRQRSMRLALARVTVVDMVTRLAQS